MNDRRIFVESHAELNKSRTGEKYRPTSGEEGRFFYSRWCFDCKLDSSFRNKIDEGCRIWGLAHALKEDHADYPPELQYGADGQPRCTAHEPDRSKAATEVGATT